MGIIGVSIWLIGVAKRLPPGPSASEILVLQSCVRCSAA